jgi:hypothetical protein
MLYGSTIEPIAFRYQKSQAVLTIAAKVHAGEDYEFVGPPLSGAKLHAWFNHKENLVILDIIEDGSGHIIEREKRAYSKSDLLLLAISWWN